jgi:hypothetical protein
MPYRLNPKDKTMVEVKRGENRWQLVKKHPNEKAARKHLAALQINVEDKKH